MILSWDLLGIRTLKASVEAIRAGRATPEMLAILCLYGLSSAHKTLKVMKTIVNVTGAKDKLLVVMTFIIKITRRNAYIARMYPDNAW